MNIKLFRDLGKFTLTSTLTAKDIQLLKKYSPDSLKLKDAEGNDTFAIGYSEGHPCISPIGVTFGSTSTEGGYAQVIGDIPENIAPEKVGDYIADKVGEALSKVNAFEETLPEVVASVTAERATLIASIQEA